MAKNKKDKNQKSWFKGLQSEFKRITWTTREDLAKQTVAVVSITAIMCVIISVMDTGILSVVNLLMK